mgnify:CR=1 FL=1|jgi:hypothetical protein
MMRPSHRMRCMQNCTSSSCRLRHHETRSSQRSNCDHALPFRPNMILQSTRSRSIDPKLCTLCPLKLSNSLALQRSQRLQEIRHSLLRLVVSRSKLLRSNNDERSCANRRNWSNRIKVERCSVCRFEYMALMHNDNCTCACCTSRQL